MDRREELKNWTETWAETLKQNTLLGKAVSWIIEPTPTEQSTPVVYDPLKSLSPEYLKDFPNTILRPGEAVNLRGNPFGGSIQSAAYLPLQSSPLEDSVEILACVGHADSGVSLVHFKHDREKGWRHDIQKQTNYRITTAFSFSQGVCSEVALLGVTCVKALPWNNFVALDDDGYLLEIDSRQGVVYRHEDFGVINADRIELLEPTRGKPVEILFFEGEKLTEKFVSEKKYDPSRPQESTEYLRKGVLEKQNSVLG